MTIEDYGRRVIPPVVIETRCCESEIKGICTDECFDRQMALFEKHAADALARIEVADKKFQRDVSIFYRDLNPISAIVSVIIDLIMLICKFCYSVFESYMEWRTRSSGVTFSAVRRSRA